MAPHPLLIALNRFGHGPRSAAALYLGDGAADPRAFVRAEIEKAAPRLEGAPAAQLFVGLFEAQEKVRLARETQRRPAPEPSGAPATRDMNAPAAPPPQPPDVRYAQSTFQGEAMARIINPAEIRWISWSHFEVDECGALNQWLAEAPRAQPFCTEVGALVNLRDFSDRPARGLRADETIDTGRHRYRLIATPHLPHGWDAGVLFEETRKTLFCSDLFHQFGNGAPVTSSDLIEPARKALQQMRQGPLAEYMPYTSQTEGILRGLAALEPGTLAVMHGSSYAGKSGKLLTDLAGVIKESFDGA